jgi:hypothetical protein
LWPKRQHHGFDKEWTGRGNKSGQVSAVRLFKTNNSFSYGIYTVNFASCPEKLPRPTDRMLP